MNLRIQGTYYINEAAPRVEMFPQFFPEGRWMVELLFSFYNEPMITLQWVLSVSKQL